MRLLLMLCVILMQRLWAWRCLCLVFGAKIWRHGKFTLANLMKMGGACRRNKQSENGAAFGWETSLSLSLSLASFLFTIYFFNFLNLFARFVILNLLKKSEKSKEFKTHFKFKVKNLHKLKAHLLFLDTSLCSVW